MREAIELEKTRENHAPNEYLERLQKHDSLYKKMEKDIANVGILSLSKTPDNVLMLTHYADNHKGFCIGFDFSERFTKHNNDRQILGATEAYYCKDNPFSEYFLEIAKAKPQWKDFWQNILATGMTAKADSWSYENEVRIIKISLDRSHSNLGSFLMSFLAWTWMSQIAQQYANCLMQSNGNI